MDHRIGPITNNDHLINYGNASYGDADEWADLYQELGIDCVTFRVTTRQIRPFASTIYYNGRAGNEDPRWENRLGTLNEVEMLWKLAFGAMTLSQVATDVPAEERRQYVWYPRAGLLVWSLSPAPNYETLSEDFRRTLTLANKGIEKIDVQIRGVDPNGRILSKLTYLDRKNYPVLDYIPEEDLSEIISQKLVAGRWFGHHDHHHFLWYMPSGFSVGINIERDTPYTSTLRRNIPMTTHTVSKTVLSTETAERIADQMNAWETNGFERIDFEVMMPEEADIILDDPNDTCLSAAIVGAVTGVMQSDDLTQIYEEQALSTPSHQVLDIFLFRLAEEARPPLGRWSWRLDTDTITPL